MMANWHKAHKDGESFGERLADQVAQAMGSWRFIGILTAFILLWIIANIATFLFVGWDPYPFILLNLLFSAQATYSAPLIMMAQNRQSERDRVHAQHDYDTNADSNERLRRIEKLLLKDSP